MSLTQDLVAVTQAADNLTQQVADKIADINQEVQQFKASAQHIVAESASQLRVANVGLEQQPAQAITIGPDDDAGVLVNEAFANGMKSVTVDWVNDGKERHWNTLVMMPIGGALLIKGPISTVDRLGGEPRADRACYKQGRRGGTSQLGSPLIFRNLQPSPTAYPANDHFKVTDETSLILMLGNNQVFFGNGTYLHDQGGMTPYMRGQGLIRVTSYRYGLINNVTGGGNYTQFYLSGPLVNNCRGTSTVQVRMQGGDFKAVTSDGPVLEVDKGFRRLKNRGLAVSNALLTKQVYELTAEDTALVDNLYSGYAYHPAAATRVIDDAGTMRPRLLGFTTWSYGTGSTTAQFGQGIGTLSLANMTNIEGTTIYIGGY